MGVLWDRLLLHRIGKSLLQSFLAVVTPLNGIDLARGLLLRKSRDFTQCFAVCDSEWLLLENIVLFFDTEGGLSIHAGYALAASPLGP